MNYQKVYMNQIYTSSLVGQVAHMWRNQLLCDAVIKTGNINTKAHRLVLIAACPMLQHMENASVGSHLEVRLSSDIKQSSVTTFLQYLYEGFMMLTEENCKDVEKIGKLLHVDSVVKCCIDFYKCLSSKTGAPITEGNKFDNQDQLEFRYVRATELQKTLQDSALKRSSSDNVRPASPQSKRQKVHRPGSPPLSFSIQRSTPQRMDDRFSMAHSYSSPQDPFERVPRLGSGMTQGRPPPSGVIEIIEDSVEVVNTEPRERDSEGWPKQSDLPPIQRSMSVSVSSQMSADQDVQIINVSNSGSHQSTKTLSTSSSRHSSDPLPRQSLDSTIEIAPVRTHEPPKPRPPELTRPSDRQPVSFIPDNSSMFRTSESVSFSSSNVESTKHSDQSHDSTVKDDSENSVRQQSQNTPTKQSTPNISNIPLQRSVHSQPQMRSMPAPQTSKPFAAGSASQTSQSSSPLAASASPVAASPRSQSGDTSHPPVQSPAWSSQDSGQKLQQYSQQIQSDDVERLLAPDIGDPGSVTSSKSDTQQQSPPDSMADLSIVKIEEAPDTGGLDMYVDFGEDQKNIVTQGEVDDHDKSYESEEPSIDWAGEEYSNEGSNLSADQSGLSWQAQGQSGSLNKGEGYLASSVVDEKRINSLIQRKLSALNKRQDKMELATHRVESKLDTLLQLHISENCENPIKPSKPLSSSLEGPSHGDDPFKDIPSKYHLSVNELTDIHSHSTGPGNFAKNVCEKLFPELYGRDHLRFGYSYFGGGQLSKRELDPIRKLYLKRYVLYLHPELQDKAMWRDSIVPKINESLRRPLKPNKFNSNKS